MDSDLIDVLADAIYYNVDDLDQLMQSGDGDAERIAEKLNRFMDCAERIVDNPESHYGLLGAMSDAVATLREYASKAKAGQA